MWLLACKLLAFQECGENQVTTRSYKDDKKVTEYPLKLS